jgi:hypothetical protein
MTEPVRDRALQHPTDRRGPVDAREGALTTSWRVFGDSKYCYKDEELSDSRLNEAIGL